MKNLIKIFFVIVATVIAMNSCNNAPQQMSDIQEINYDSIVNTKKDKMIYGLACDGSSDSVIVLWPYKGDPKRYSIIDAKQNQKVFGKAEIGDWVGVMVNPEDSTEATMAIDLDVLKGTWTYPVMPVMKDLQNMSRRMQRRMIAQMNDSIKTNYLIPRDYGFTLSRSNMATPVGYAMRSNSLEDDSPVTYPEVKNIQRWYMINGKLLLVSVKRHMGGTKDEQPKKPEVSIDTMTFKRMEGDTLVLAHGDSICAFHRTKATNQQTKK